MNKNWKKLEQKFATSHNYKETEMIVSGIEKLFDSKDIFILDVGCGYGQKTQALKAAGFKHVLGVDTNKKLIELGKKNGLNCIHYKHLDRNRKFDIILMSHIIEHFDAKGLVDFIDSYLDILNVGGYLVILTPLSWNGFYRDLDHVKPYSPWGILSVFEQDNSQVQYYGKNKLVLHCEPLARRMPFQISAYKNFILQKKNVFEKGAQLILNLCFYLTFGKFGKINAWFGIFKKA